MSAFRQTSLLALALAALAAACSRAPQASKPTRKAPGKVLVMGFDGMDPTLARKFMDEGKLPNLKRLAEQGSFAPLQSSQPSESPTAWSSFATGANPGKHNIYDFVVRDINTYLPDVGMKKKEPPEYRWGLVEIKPRKDISLRGGTSFWLHAGRDGVQSIVLTVPMTWPPESIEHGEMLAGLPLPDMRDTIGTFYYWATDLTSFEEGNTEFGGYLKTLLFEGGVADTVLKGPENPILRQEERELKDKKKKAALTDAEQKRLDELAKGKDVLVPVKVKWSENAGQAEIEVQDQRLALKAGQWSDWVPLTFKFNFLATVHGMTQFYLVRADKELQLYASPVNMDPRNPPLPISKPDDFAPRLAKQLGIYRTLGWAESADKALNEGRLSEADFLYDAEKAFEDRERIILKNLERTDWDLFVAVIETTDRISHMMWRLIDPKHPMYDAALAAKHGDAIEKVYRRADSLVGRLLEKMPEGTTFMVMSDHGFHSFRRGVNLNTWLVQNGYMKFEGRESEKKTLAD